ncbi:MAG: hypothetical protein JWO91_2224 [Acidobacteriaceae bacterium]|nr:hypothetical protein [Acidobacteriaceae bacterium]
MNVNRISLLAIKQLHLELDRLEKQARREIEHANSRSLGTMRLDLIEECRRRLAFFHYMLKDAESQADERRRFGNSE